MRYPESLIFDIDGTLWDSRALVAAGYNLQLAAEGHPLRVDAAQLAALFGKTMRQIADILFPELSPEPRYALMERCMATENRYLAENPCQVGYPGVKQTLSRLAKNHRLFVVSNSQRGYPELCLDKLGIRQLFSGWLCYGDTGTCKGETIRILMRTYGIESAVYIGDTETDAEAARQAGIPFIWASYGFGAPAQYDAWINTPSELPAVLEG